MLPSGLLSVLVLAEIGSVFLIVAGTRPCLAFENSVDKTDLFSTAEQCLHRTKAFSAPHPTPPEKAGEPDELGGDPADPS